MTSGTLALGARGAVALGLRQLFVQLLSVVAAVLLARLLTPAEFGVYGITVFLMHFLVVFGDAGLAAGLVREEREPEDEDWLAVFSFQQLLVLVVAALGLAAGPLLSGWLWREGELGWLLPALLVALLLSSFQTMPAARLERQLAFDRLAVIEVAQALAFNVVAVVLAFAGLGADAMAAALVARALAGVVLVQVVAPWKIGWHWDWQRLRSRLRFGLAFQGAAFVNLLRDALVPVFAGAMLGNAAVGVIFFARMLAFYPFLIVYMLQRVLLPMFARLQQDAAGLAEGVRLSIFAVAALVVPVQTTVWALQDPFVRVVFGDQWLVSLGIYQWLWFASLLEPQIIVGVALLNALGKADRTLRFTVTMSLLLWALGAPLLLLFGPVGYGIAAWSALAIKWKLLHEVDAAAGTHSLRAVLPVWAAALASAAVVLLLRFFWIPDDAASLVAMLAIAAASYLVALFVFEREQTLSALAWLRAEATSMLRSGAALAPPPATEAVPEELP